jgi:ABC-type nitrate/sulfonate/bicarbonate transport system permease component
VIGEWVGAGRGLGYLMLLANGRARIELMFAAPLALAIVLTVLLNAAVDRARGGCRSGARDDGAEDAAVSAREIRAWSRAV